MKFLRTNWLGLLAAIPAAIGADLIYRAVAVLFTPSPSGDYRATSEALEAFAERIPDASANVGLVAFFGVIAFVIWKWRKAGLSRSMLVEEHEPAVGIGGASTAAPLEGATAAARRAPS